MKLVKLENYEIKIEDELLLLNPFKKLWDKDNTKDKSKFLEFLSILYFWLDPRSDYSYIIDSKLRFQEVCESNGYKNYNIDKFNNDENVCIALYKKLTTTTSLKALESTRLNIDKLQHTLDNIDYEQLEEKDKVSALKTVASTIGMMPKLIKDLSEIEKTVAKEIEESSRARGNQGNKTLMDDSILF